MKTKITLLILILFLILPLINAGIFNSGDITFSLNQSEYYFLTGQQATIPLEVENTYGKPINGLLSYTYTQEINQGGFHYSSSNTNSNSFTAEDGKNIVGLSFGTSDTQMDLKVDLSFKYTEKETRKVDLNNIIIHFVADQNQQQNQQNKVQSSSQKYTQPKQQQQDPFAQHEQRMQQMMDEMFGNQQQPKNAQQRVQNNQMAQDSNALKQQMQKQLQEQQKMKKEFQKQLAKNQEFQKKHQSLLNQGYNVTDGLLNPTSNNTGSFEINYQNRKGEQATLNGEMKDGNMQRIEKHTSEERQKILDELKKNEKFQKFDKQIKKEGYIQQNAEFNHDEDKTEVKLNYLNQKNQTAKIKAEFINKTIEKVEFEKVDEKKSLWWLYLLFILLATLLGYFIYKKYVKKPVEEEKKPKVEEKPFDYIVEAKKILEEAKKLFEEKKEKDAYEKASQAIRFYYSYKLSIKTELTNSDLIKLLKKHKIIYEKTQKCLNLCGLVEFAKYEANKKDFDKIIKIAKEIII